MDKQLSVHNKNPKLAKPKKQGVKVVYISNPMKVKTSASKFRALVQELTGQDSNIDDLSKFSMLEDDTEEVSESPEPVSGVTDDLPGPAQPNPGGARRGADPDHNLYKSVVTPFEMFDESFTPQMLESFLGLSPSSLQIDAFRSFDAV